MRFHMQDSADEAATSERAAVRAAKLFLVFLAIFFFFFFLILDCAEGCTKSLRVTYTLQFPLCGSTLE